MPIPSPDVRLRWVCIPVPSRRSINDGWIPATTFVLVAAPLSGLAGHAGLFRPVQEQGWLAHPPAAVDQDKLRAALGKEAVELIQLALSPDEFTHL